MKRVYRLLSMVSAAALITGCGGGGGGGGSAAAVQQQQPVAKTIPLNVGEKTSVKPGDRIVNASDDAVVDIVVVGEERTVTLKTGSAALQRPVD